MFLLNWQTDSTIAMAFIYTNIQNTTKLSRPGSERTSLYAVRKISLDQTNSRHGPRMVFHTNLFPRTFLAFGNIFWATDSPTITLVPYMQEIFLYYIMNTENFSQRNR